MNHRERVDMVMKMIKDGMSDRFILNRLSTLPDYDRETSKVHIKTLRMASV